MAFKTWMIAAAIVIACLNPVAAGQNLPGAGERWEQALLSAKRHGTLAGPRPGQVCLWCKPLGACLWYTPANFQLKAE